MKMEKNIKSRRGSGRGVGGRVDVNEELELL